MTTQEEQEEIVRQAKLFAQVHLGNDSKAAAGVKHIRSLLAVVQQMKQEKDPEYQREVLSDEGFISVPVIRRGSVRGTTAAKR